MPGTFYAWTGCHLRLTDWDSQSVSLLENCSRTDKLTYFRTISCVQASVLLVQLTIPKGRADRAKPVVSRIPRGQLQARSSNERLDHTSWLKGIIAKTCWRELSPARAAEGAAGEGAAGEAGEDLLRQEIINLFALDEWFAFAHSSGCILLILAVFCAFLWTKNNAFLWAQNNWIWDILRPGIARDRPWISHPKIPWDTPTQVKIFSSIFSYLGISFQI